jgi:flavin reductase (DIM6/NTAB) family NADH-FMN oxidoreductase RutF
MSVRPVFLVSVEWAGRTNMFPMDLIGTLTTGELLLALRASSAAIELIEGSRRVALSATHPGLLKEVYALGNQHGKASIDVRALPLPIGTSQRFHLPVLEALGRVLEVEVHEVHHIGSHVLFVGRVVSEAGKPATRLAHISGMYAEWLERQHRGVQSLAQ